MGVYGPVTDIKGIGEKTAALYHRLDINTIYDLITYYPRDYEEFEKPDIINSFRFGHQATVYAKLNSQPRLLKKNNLIIVIADFSDVYGNRFQAEWYNQTYLCKTLRTGNAYVVRGLYLYKNSTKVMSVPQIYTPDEYNRLQGRLMPVYSLTHGLSRAGITKAVEYALDNYIKELESDIEKLWPDREKIMCFSDSIRQIHFPKNKEAAKEARDRIVLEEFYNFFVKIRKNVIERKKKTGSLIIKEYPEMDLLIKGLPFKLTPSQENAWKILKCELSGGSVMHRLIQGDVGSGKTIIAFLAMLSVVLNGYQAVLMAPTAVLAKQHYDNFCRCFPEFSEKAVLLTGQSKASEKKKIYAELQTGGAGIIIGTHAVFQEKVIFEKLALVITDEQHRFGVAQRHMLAEKGDNTHVLYMSATPIPRSLAGVLYNDLDVTIIDGKPAGREKIHTCVIPRKDRNKAYRFISSELSKGHQAYVICPLVEESELLDGENVLDYSRLLQKEFMDRKVGILHGRMQTEEKNRAMSLFSSGETDILVSTTVVEVGVDVPNASVIMIENADRFGLAQLHQLRGRVGRGGTTSYCILVNSSENETDNKRLDIMNNSDDGFEIAAKDFTLRGQGDVLGTRQSGDMSFKLADIFRDKELLELARKLAEKIITE